MENDTRKIAIYSRKSKFTGKGDSINNQIEYCKKHLGLKYPDLDMEEDILIFEDEGFSGGNTNRPKFQEMVDLISKKRIKCVCCYKLDRISRNVLDFSNLNCELDKHNVSFLSVTENFDTTTPLGKAMLTITSVFAQLERDTIAERIKDNMIELAKTGRWLGGTTPRGYTAEQITYKSLDGKSRTLWKLNIVKEEAKIVELIFNKYNELKSLTKLETYLIQNNIKTRNDIFYSRFALRSLLTNPVYATADKDVYKYFIDKDVEVHNDIVDFNGKHALMVYNKTTQSKNKARYKDVKDWIIAIGKHKGIVSGRLWVDTQLSVATRGSKSYRTQGKNNALLSGILRCSHCGSFMRPKLKTHRNASGELVFTYMCQLKERSRRVNCQCPTINGNETDKMVLESIEKLINNESLFYERLKKLSKGVFTVKANKVKQELNELRKSLNSNEKDIICYTKKIIHLNDDVLLEVNKQITLLKQQNVNINEQIKKLELSDQNNTTEKENAKIALEIIDTYFNTFHSLDIESKRNMIRTLVSSIISDGETIFINFVGAKELDGNVAEPLCEDSK